MPTHKNYNKTQEVKKHLFVYGSIDRNTAARLFKVYDLPDYIRRIKKTLPSGCEIARIENSSPNTKYKLMKS